MQVSPSVSRAPAAITVRVAVEAAVDDRRLNVAAESPTFFTSSEMEIDPARSAPVSVFEFRNLPAGLYTVSSTLVGSHGPRATVSQLAKVEPPFGSR